MPDRGASSARELRWEGGRNLRDLGGLPLEGGGETRFGAVVRSATPGGLTAAGWGAAAAHGIRTIVDLRCPSEHDARPPASLDVVHAPLFEQDDEAFWAEARDTPTWADFYRVIVESRAERVVRAVGALADAQPGGVLLHCHGGKDRTGIVSALVLSLVGVPDEAIVDDFEASAPALRPFLARPEDADCEPGAIAAVLELVRERRGGAGPYLLSAGAEPAQLDRLRERLVPG